MSHPQINLESIDAAACARLRSLIITKRDKSGKTIGSTATFATHMPEARIKQWVTDEFDRTEIEKLMMTLAQELVDKYVAEEAKGHDRSHAKAA